MICAVSTLLKLLPPLLLICSSNVSSPVLAVAVFVCTARFAVNHASVANVNANTANNVVTAQNQVLGYNENGVFATTDPSVLVSDYTISFTNNQMTLPKSALLSMEFGKIYAVDIYFYLEGCDPDCSESVQFNEANLHLAFYGVLDQKEGN